MGEKELRLALGKRIRQLRRERGLTQEKVSEKAGTITEKRWSDIERGRYSIGLDTLFKIGKGLNVPLHELFLFDTPKSVQNRNSYLKKEILKLEKQAGKVEKEAKILRKNALDLQRPLE